MPADEQKPLVLIVDDDPAIRALCESTVAPHFRTVTAENGIEALHQLRAHKPDLILLDIGMPVLDGWETYRRIREIGNTPVIMLTGWQADDHVVRGLDAGVDDYMTKPFSPTQLLARIRAALRRQASARDEFFASAVHDLKNPLAIISARTQLLQRQAARMDGPEAGRAAEGLARIQATVGQVTALIHELLDVSRLQTGQPVELSRRPMDLVALAWQVGAEHQQSTDQHQVRVVADAPEIIGEWDPMRLRRVLDNLIGNAIKYSPSGGEVTVTVRREIEGPAEWAVVSVRDSGVGIPAADLAHVFERFSRASNVGKIAGTGIGLATSQRIVEQHGGTIAVTSQEGEGSTFTVRLPITHDARSDTGG